MKSLNGKNHSDREIIVISQEEINMSVMTTGSFLALAIQCARTYIRIRLWMS